MSQSSRVPLICARCEKTFFVQPCQVTRARFCSRTCTRPLLPHPDDPTALLVPLTQGAFAVIDRDDGPLVAPYNWSLSVGRRKFYACTAINRATARLHRIVRPDITSPELDHKDGDGLNCRKSNLRAASREENSHNADVRRDNTSGYRGVSFVRTKGRWTARISANHQSHFLGFFDTPERAAQAYDDAARRLHGEFASVNFPRDGERRCDR